MSLHQVHSHTVPAHDHTDDRLPFFKSPLVYSQDISLLRRQQLSDDASQQSRNRYVAVLEGRTQHSLHHHEEATMSELFYDLFFVANLTTFTAAHPVNDPNTLAQYVGYFSILWFLWYQVSLYDVRLAMDSVFERSAKALHLGVMVGFAMAGPDFKVGEASGAKGEGPMYGAFRALTLVLMASRLILVLQYLQTWWLTRAYQRTRLPLLLIAASYFAAASVYLGLFWAFHPVRFGINYTYVVWYVVAVLETTAVTVISAISQSVSFKGTHLVQRMSLLNLIILGEGVIVLAKQCQLIIKCKALTLEASAIGNVISSVLILYFLYMIYADWMEEGHVGRTRQQIWAFLHFPLHLFQVLAVEGASQAIAWRAATVARRHLEHQALGFDFATNAMNATYWQAAASSMNHTAEEVLTDLIYVASDVDRALAVGASADIIRRGLDVTSRGAQHLSDGLRGVRIVYTSLCVLFYEIGGFHSAGDDAAMQSISADQPLEALEQVLWERGEIDPD